MTSKKREFGEISDLVTKFTTDNPGDDSHDVYVRDVKRPRILPAKEQKPKKEKHPRKEFGSFSRQLAIDLNDRQPDVVAAKVFEEISFHLNQVPPYCFRDGKRWYFRSLTELSKDMPYLDRKLIASAIARLKKKGYLESSDDYGKVRWYHIPTKLKRRYDKTTPVWFRTENAQKYDIRAALILGNIEWQFTYWDAFETDEHGNKYAKLSPSALSERREDDHGIPVLPISRDGISDLIKELCTEHQVLVAHPIKDGFYALSAGFKKPDSTPRSVEHVAEDRDNVAEDRDSCAEDRDSKPSKSDCKPYSVYYLQQDESRVNYIITCNLHIKDKDYIATASATPSQRAVPPSELSASATKLMELVEADLTQMDQSVTRQKVTMVSPSALPYDIPSKDMELPFIIARKKRGWITLRSQEIQEIVSLIKTTWRLFDIPYTREDLGKLTKLFTDNPSLTHDHWRQIEAAIHGTQHDDSPRKYKYDTKSFLRGAKTAKYRLRYLPQIVSQMFIRRTYDKDRGYWIEDGMIPAPYNSLDYSYLGKKIDSKFIEVPTIGTVHVIEPEEEDQNDG